MPLTRYGTLKTVTVFQEMAKTGIDTCASEKVSVLDINREKSFLDIKAVQYIEQGEKCPC